MLEVNSIMKSFLIDIASSSWFVVIFLSILAWFVISIISMLLVSYVYGDSTKKYEKLKSQYESLIVSNRKDFDSYISDKFSSICYVIFFILAVIISGVSITTKTTSRTEVHEIQSTSYKIGFEEGDYFVVNQTDSINGLFSLLTNSPEYSNFYVFKINDSEYFDQKFEQTTADLWTSYSDDSAIYSVVKNVSKSYSSLNAYDTSIKVDNDELVDFLRDSYDGYIVRIKLSELKKLMSDKNVELFVDVTQSKSSISLFSILKPEFSKADEYTIKYRVVDKNQNQKSKTNGKSKKTSIFDVD